MLRNKGRHRRRVLTADGEIELQHRYFWTAGSGGAYPSDEAAGIAQESVSPGAREILCRMGMIEDFGQAAADAARIGNVAASKERLRQIVEAEARRLAQARDAGELTAVWTSRDARVAGTDKTRVYGGVDGVMVPMVSQAEKDKRRETGGASSPAGAGGGGQHPAAAPGTAGERPDLQGGQDRGVLRPGEGLPACVCHGREP